MLGRHSLFWKLAALLVTFCLLVISLSNAWTSHVEDSNSRLSEESRHELKAYAWAADRAVTQGAQEVDAFLAQVKRREQRWAVVLNATLQPLGTQALTPQERDRLTFMRRLSWPMRKRRKRPHLVAIPLDSNPGYFVIELPERMRPDRYIELVPVVQYLLPALLALVFGMGLYRILIGPLVLLREQAAALRADRLDGGLCPQLSGRQDELGELALTLEHMASRLKASADTQRHLLHDLSHELRTPLARLQAAADGKLSQQVLNQRIEREVQGMRLLIEDTLELAWLDTERPRLQLVPVELPALWDMLCEDACFEARWVPERLPCLLPDDCRVLGDLNALARAMENILRNAIRHSPEGGTVQLGGYRDGQDWVLWIQDQGPGVADGDLQRIFQPFTRLNASRPGREGFGLGLAIAERMLSQQGSCLGAENVHPGLRLWWRLRAA